MVDSFGDFRKKSYKEETAILKNFLDELGNHHTADISLLNVTEWIDSLKNLNNTFSELMAMRFSETVSQEYINLRETRHQAETIYNQMENRINAGIIYAGETPFAQFVSELNVLIDYYKRSLTNGADQLNHKPRGGAKCAIRTKQKPAVDIVRQPVFVLVNE